MGTQNLTAEQMARKALDYVEIQNVMSKHMYYHAAGKHREELAEIWAQKHEITFTGGGGGKQVGEEVYKAYVDNHDINLQRDLERVVKVHPEIENKKENWGIGTLSLHCQTTPIIEVAEDGQTAQGIWYTPGIVTEIDKYGNPFPMNIWEKYGVDFVKEDGEWKIWHLHLYGDLGFGPGESWTDPKDNRMAPPPSSDPAGYQGYSPTTVPVIIPKIPKPYKTFDDVTPF